MACPAYQYIFEEIFKYSHFNMTRKTTELNEYSSFSNADFTKSKFDLVFNSAINQCHLGYWDLYVADDGPSLRKHRVYQKHVRVKNQDYK